MPQGSGGVTARSTISGGYTRGWLRDQGSGFRGSGLGEGLAKLPEALNPDP